MKILHIIPTLHTGGAEKFCIDLCNELSIDHDVTLCTLYSITDEMFLAKQVNKNVHLISLNKKNGFDLSLFFDLHKIIKNEKADVINTHVRGLIYTSLSAIVMQKSFFHTVHNMAKLEAGKINRMMYKLLFRYFNVKPIAISKRVLKSIKAEYGQQFNILIDNGIKQPVVTKDFSKIQKEVEGYKLNTETKVFINIGRIAEQKNQTMLVETFNQLFKENENIILLIIGDDYSSEQLLKKSLISIADENIFFLDLKSNVSDYLACSDAFCLSSLYEGLPITLLEALGLGIIPICTPAGGIIDVVTDDFGFTSDGFKKGEYIQSVKKFLSLSENEKQIMSDICKNIYTKDYNITRTAKKYIEIYSNNRFGL